MPTLLTRMGFNKITKRLLFYGPPNLGDFGFTDTYTDQGIAHLQMFLGQLRHDNELAQLMHMHILLEKVQLQMGVSGKPFLSSNIDYPLKYIEPNWLTSLWNFTNHIKATLHIEDAWELQPQRTNDKCIMDIFHCKHLNLQPKELKRLNACCLFLQVITVADLTDGSGTKIIVDYLQ